MTVFAALRLPLLICAVLPVLGSEAMAGQRHYYPPPPPPPYADEPYYSGPPMLRHIPGLRILFGDYALTEEEFNALYGDGQPRKNRRFDESYYEPEPAPPKAKTVKPPATAKQPATAAKPATGAAAPTQGQKTASASSSSTSGPLTCEKATQVVSGYGFSSVEASSCAGKVYAFNAKRDGKSFAIKLDPSSGELTEVKKLP